MVKGIFSVLLVFLIILLQVEGQGGGGGGGGAVDAFGNLIMIPSYYYGSPGSCEQRCQGNTECIDKCKRDAIIGSSIGGSTLIAFFAGFICCTKRSCILHKYQKLKKMYNVVNAGNVSEQQFKLKRDKIISWINLSQNVNNYSFKQADKNYQMHCTCKIIKEKPFLTEIQVKGNDYFGAWNAGGFILCRNGGQIFLWLYKQYNKKKAAGQTGNFQHLIHQSIKIEDNHIQGKWFYIGHQTSNIYSGNWNLQDQAFTNLENQLGKHITGLMGEQIKKIRGGQIQSAQNLN